MIIIVHKYQIIFQPLSSFTFAASSVKQKLAKKEKKLGKENQRITTYDGRRGGARGVPLRGRDGAGGGGMRLLPAGGTGGCRLLSGGGGGARPPPVFLPRPPGDGEEGL